MKLDQAEQFARLFVGLFIVVCLTGLCVAFLSSCSPPATKATRSAGHAWGEWCMNQPYPEREFCRAECLRRFDVINDTRDDDCIDAVARR